MMRHVAVLLAVSVALRLSPPARCHLVEVTIDDVRQSVLTAMADR